MERLNEEMVSNAAYHTRAVTRAVPREEGAYLPAEQNNVSSLYDPVSTL